MATILTTRSIVIIGLLVLVTSGCSLPNLITPRGSATMEPSIPAVSIVYSTASDRLNLAARGTNRLASAGHTGTRLPSFTQSRLELHHPHPSGQVGAARAVLTIKHGGRSPDHLIRTGTWLLDVPAWQVVGILKRLKDEEFFLDTTVVDAEAQLTVNEDGNEHTRSFGSIAELDALIWRVFEEGQPVHLASNQLQHR